MNEEINYVDELNEELLIETAAVEFQLDMMREEAGVNIHAYILQLQCLATWDGIKIVTPADLLRVYNIIKSIEE